MNTAESNHHPTCLTRYFFAMDDNHKLPKKVIQEVLSDSLQTRRDVTTGREQSSESRVVRDDNRSGSSRGPVRVFRSQESVTNTLISSDPNFQAIHDAFLIQLLLILLFALVKDSYSAGRLYLNISLLSIGFGTWSDLIVFALIEVSLLLWAFLVHPGLKLWEKRRGASPYFLDIVFVLLYAVYIFTNFVSIIYLVSNLSLPHLVNFVIGIEQFRLFMKSYSFVRENAYKVLYPWHKDDTTGPAVWYAGQMSPTVGSFSQYVYFLFCPTLLYRDHYPRVVDGIRWRAVATGLTQVITYMTSVASLLVEATSSISVIVQFLLALWSSVFIVTNILYPPSLKQADLIHLFMMCLVMGFAIKLIGHTAILHGYLNMSAELMRFADHQFFSEWWTCTSYSSYYRKWNLLVHDWIHSYIYNDLKKLIGKHTAVFSTLLVSSVVHEYLLAMGIGFVLPIVTFLFAGVGAFFYVLKPLNTRRASNLFFLSTLNLGLAIIMFLLLFEYAARQYCPVEKNTWITALTPQMFGCYSVYNS